MTKGLKLEVVFQPSAKDTLIQSLIKELQSVLIIQYYEKYSFSIFSETDRLLYLFESLGEAQIVKVEKQFKEAIVTVFANHREYEDIAYYWTELSRTDYQMELEVEQDKQAGIYIGHGADNVKKAREEPMQVQKTPIYFNSLRSDDDQKIIGALPLKALIAEIRKIAIGIHKNQIKEVLIARSYIFSINEGDGFSTYLDCLAQTLTDEKILTIDSPKKVFEVQLDHPSKYEKPSLGISNAISYFDESASPNGIIAIDISEWLSHLDDPKLVDLLDMLWKYRLRFVFVFRVPYLEKRTLHKLETRLNDLLFTQTLAFPPFHEEQLFECLEQKIRAHGFKLDKDAFISFLQLLAQEKSDGRFYGLKTIDKIAQKLILDQLILTDAACHSSIGTANFRHLINDDHVAAEDVRIQIKELIGHEQIKKRVEEIISLIKNASVVTKQDSRLKPSFHMLFTGNPGTGKTTFARLIGKRLKEEGVLNRGHFIEISGRDLVGRYVGETAPKTAEICKSAYGSVLFIDEAYSLYNGQTDSNDFGKEALAVLVAEMENNRDKMVIIFSGYQEEIEQMMAGNRGLDGRIPHHLHFNNYSKDELTAIFNYHLKINFDYETDLLTLAEDFFNRLPDSLVRSSEFSNGRFVRNLIERVWSKAALRYELSSQNELEHHICLTAADFRQAVSDNEFSQLLKKDVAIKMGF